ncbi:MAG TPA: hypothetical protein VH478_00655 [Trebonia sp.]|jgi:hypothetical protein|nr:hypothetical protein [Trebonia sp.]
MPELDYMVLADYVRQDNGVIHIMGAGIDTITAPTVPTVVPLGIALKLSFDTTERPGEVHQLTVAFIGADKPVMDASATFTTPPRPPHLPEHWKTGLGVALQIPVPLPQYGDYSCELSVDGDLITKSYEFRVIHRPA